MNLLVGHLRSRARQRVERPAAAVTSAFRVARTI